MEKVDKNAEPISDKATQLQITKVRTPTELFELFPSDDVIELIVTYANIFAASNGVVLSLMNSELICFLGLFFQMVMSQFLDGVCSGNTDIFA
ncbi:hypothetical protein TNCV_4850521 [Trichonephila clavipes]|nr:hypothetical protein TNCV_4850521 [Trichonephila clavipes]